ncbi:MAG: hypothetical protein FWG66_03345 [Spirochaetes bacterium]|nr:hypothetical protein [Spirochaetota bacterium]
MLKNTAVAPGKRKLPPGASALVTFILPGFAQALNGQMAKGLCLLLLAPVALWLGGLLLYFIYALAVSSDAFVCAMRQRTGEHIGSWDFLYQNLKTPKLPRRTLFCGALLLSGSAGSFTADLLVEDGIIKKIGENLAGQADGDCEIVNAPGAALVSWQMAEGCPANLVLIGEDSEPQIWLAGRRRRLEELPPEKPLYIPGLGAKKTG